LEEERWVTQLAVLPAKLGARDAEQPQSYQWEAC
jgi:hypothetical protein